MRFFYHLNKNHPNYEYFAQLHMGMGVVSLMQWDHPSDSSMALREVNRPMPQVVVDLLTRDALGSPLIINRRLRSDNSADQEVIAAYGID